MNLQILVAKIHLQYPSKFLFSYDEGGDGLLTLTWGDWKLSPSRAEPLLRPGSKRCPCPYQTSWTCDSLPCPAWLLWTWFGILQIDHCRVFRFTWWSLIVSHQQGPHLQHEHLYHRVLGIQKAGCDMELLCFWSHFVKTHFFPSFLIYTYIYIHIYIHIYIYTYHIDVHIVVPSSSGCRDELNICNCWISDEGQVAVVVSFPLAWQRSCARIVTSCGHRSLKQPKKSFGLAGCVMSSCHAMWSLPLKSCQNIVLLHAIACFLVSSLLVVYRFYIHILPSGIKSGAPRPQDADKMQTRCRQDADKMQTRCRQDADKMQTRCIQDAYKLPEYYAMWQDVTYNEWYGDALFCNIFGVRPVPTSIALAWIRTWEAEFPQRWAT